MNDYYYIKCLDLYICPYIISLIKIINKFFLIIFFYNSLFINEDDDLNSSS